MERYGAILLQAVLVFIFLFIAKKIADRLTSFDDDAAVPKEKNVAVAIRRFGLYAGLGCALFPLADSALSLTGLTLFVRDGLLAMRASNPSYPKGPFLYSSPIAVVTIPNTDSLFGVP